jgi:hypothetical protein
LEQPVIYYDTDSIFYIDDGNSSVKTRSMLEDWLIKWEKKIYIRDRSFTGSMSYYCKTDEDKSKEAVKGFTLNYQNVIKLNGNALINIIEQEVKENITLNCPYVNCAQMTHFFFFL